MLKRKLLDQLDAQVSFDLPPSLVEAEAGQIAHQLWHEENPDVHGHDHPRDRAHRRAQGAGRTPGEAGPVAGRAGPEERGQGLGRRDDAGDHDARPASIRARNAPFFEFIQQNQQAQQQIRAPLFEDKVVDFITELAEVTEKEVTKDELKAARGRARGRVTPRQSAPA